jgi:DNA topoisomerase-1
MPGHPRTGALQFVRDDRSSDPIGSSDVNDYLREVTGEEFTAKDFRTWAATVACARALAGAEERFALSFLKGRARAAKRRSRAA